MIWLMAIGLALASFVLAAFAFGVPRGAWATLGAALALGLAGYGLQASPDVAGAPVTPRAQAEDTGWSLVDARREMTGERERSTSDKVLVADAFARRGRFANAAAMLNGAVADNPRDADAWLALGNALVEHAEGALTRPAMLAYRRASALDPEGTGPGYFLGLAMVRQGRLMEARGVWASTLDGAAPDAPGRAALEERLGRLDGLIQQASGGVVPVPPQEPPAS